MASNSYGRFKDALKDIEELEGFAKVKQTGRGRRWHHSSLYKAGIVLTVAAWEAYVENVLKEAFTILEPHISAADKPMFRLREAELANLVKKLNTPNKENVLKLVEAALNVKIESSWEWNVTSRRWSGTDVSKRLNGWLLVRHQIAHGGIIGTSLPRELGIDDGKILLKHMRGCKDTLTHIVDATDRALANHLVRSYGVPHAW